MSKNSLTVLLILFTILSHSFSQVARDEVLFDEGWKFKLGDIEGAENPGYDDTAWRVIDLPHDWSIEKLQIHNPGEVVGPFSKESPGMTSTGYTIGGTGWYRKTFKLNNNPTYTSTILDFDGVYMNCDVWINGNYLGTQPYGYSAFHFDISDYLNKDDRPNVLAVKVKNEGKNSRWYSGSGIYRHVWLIRKKAISIAHQGVTIETQNISENQAEILIKSKIICSYSTNANIEIMTKIKNSEGMFVGTHDSILSIDSKREQEIIQRIKIKNPELWSIDSPNLYSAEIQIFSNDKISDNVSTTFGIRSINFDVEKGFTLNGTKVLLKGGCMHHDNGFLGSATIDRAEERRVQLMKAYGFNAIRTSHNPPSRQFLDACDRNGILVIDEAFDMWERAKNPEDYHLYFDKWWKKDLSSMINRDKNHPSVIMWSIGNEINERADYLGFVIRKKLVKEVKSLDSTRPVTEAICDFWDHPGQEWSTTEKAFEPLDIGGYNYQWGKYENDHEKFPNRIMMGTESFPREAYDNWMQVEKNPWVIGDFVWTSMDYLGETGLGNSRLDDDPDQGFLRSWPWFNAFCGDIDLTGNKKTQMLYRDVIWGNSTLEIVVHSPVLEGKKELISYWGWPNEMESWNWEGFENQKMKVRVFTTYPAIRLELNGEIIDEKTLDDSSKLIINYEVPFKPGVLKAVGLVNGIEVNSKTLRTTGKPAKIKLSADRSIISSDRNDLSYVTVEITDSEGNLIPDASIPVKFSISGAGEIAGSGNACPYDMESFNSTICKTYRGRAIAIVRPLIDKRAGKVLLTVDSDGLESGLINIQVNPKN